ncbi:MAG TPA: two-component regulator propeller domain-containing protein [Chitinophagaceae bacterium]|nr:two-component regulator propeller domain-containing protein [Chitinophagaceae bacterium]
MKRLIFLVFMVGIMSSLKGQQPGYLFSYLGLRDGLHQETINVIQQDVKGYIWFGAGNVLQRYDGHRFLNFVTGSRESGIPAGNIRGLQVDKKNRVWILTGDSSIGYLDPESFKFHPAKLIAPDDFPKTVTALYLDREDQLVVIYSNKGILTYSDKNRRISRENNPFVIPKGWEPLFFWQDADHHYWVGSFNGLLKYDPGKKMISYRGTNEDADPVINQFKDAKTVIFFLKDKKGRAWITSLPQSSMFIKSFDPATGKTIEWQKKILAALRNMYYEMHGVVETSDGSLWMAGYNLFAKINYEDEQVNPIPSNLPGEFSIRYDDIYVLQEDREKNIWAATNKGLFRFNPSAQLFRKVNNRIPGKDTVYTPDVTDILDTDKGEIIVGTWGNDMFSYDREFRPILSRYYNRKSRTGFEMVWSVIQRKNGEIWQGMQAGSIYINSTAGVKTKVLRSDVIGESTVRRLAEDHNGNIWIGTQSGKLIKWDTTTGKFSMAFDSKGLVSGIIVDSRNDIWASTDRDGVYQVNAKDGSVINHYTADGPVGKRLRINGASDLLQYNDSLFIIASDGLNILNTKTGTFRYLSAENGLVSNSIQRLVKDNQGYLWMSSDMGIISYHPLRQKISTYNYNDGVHTYSFSQGAGTKLKDGRIVFGTNHDLVVFDPRKVTVTNYIVPKVEIADFRIGGQRHSVDSILKAGKIKLPYDQNSFTASLSTLTFQNTYSVLYKMAGRDKEWKLAGANNIVEYNYLPPGEYKLMLACQGENGEPGPITSLTLDIAPPFYQAWWFYILVTLTAGIIIFLLDRERMRRKEAIVKMRTGIAAKLHDDVSLALSNIHVLSEMARFKADKDTAKAIEFIEQIHSRSGNMMLSMDDMLWSISPENDSMDKMIVRMRECIDNINTREGTHFDIEVADGVRQIKFDMEQRMQVFLLFRQILNELKSAGINVCNVKMTIEKNELVYHLESRNNNFNKEQMDNSLNGYELSKRLKGINAALDVKTRENGTTVKCRIDLQN